MFALGSAHTCTIIFALIAAVFALSACEKPPVNLHQPASQAEGARSKASTTVDLARLKVKDKSGKELEYSVLEKPLLTELKITLDGLPVAGESPTYNQLCLRKQLAAHIQSKLDGTFLFLPWGKSNALVGGFSAIYLPNDPTKILICGGDESPNHVRFAADNTWLVDLTSDFVSVGPDMHWARRFPTLSALKDGRVLISGGSGGQSRGADSLTGNGGLEKIPLEVEIYDPKTSTISQAGSLKVPRDETLVVVLESGLALIVGGDRPRDQKSDAISVAPLPPTAELYNPLTETSTMLGPLSRLTAVTWAAPVAAGQALLLGPHCGLRLESKDLSEPAAEIIDTATK
jgi:hypothetical protein